MASATFGRERMSTSGSHPRHLHPSLARLQVQDEVVLCLYKSIAVKNVDDFGVEGLRVQLCCVKRNLKRIDLDFEQALLGVVLEQALLGFVRWNIVFVAHLASSPSS